MRLRVGLSLALGVLGCGRIGYDPLIATDDGGVDGTSRDAPTDASALATTCNVPVMLHSLPVAVGKHVTALELGSTTTGFIVAWSVEDEIWSAAFAVDGAHGFSVIQSGGQLESFGSPDLSMASIGNESVLAVDDATNNAANFYPLSADGYQRATTKTADAVRLHSNGFITARAGDGVFGIAAGKVGNTAALERDLDGHPWNGPVPTLSGIDPENTGIARLATGYAVLAGEAAHCNIIAVDDSLAPIGTAQILDANCHNASVVKSATSDKVVAASNCNDDAVWATGGLLSTTLPAYHTVYAGDAANSASNPRMAATSIGIWYGFQVTGNRLGRLLLDDDGTLVPAVSPDIVVPDDAVMYDLAAHNDAAFLFWTDPAASLWAMRLCAP
jgi:hypothetical protein